MNRDIKVSHENESRITTLNGHVVRNLITLEDHGSERISFHVLDFEDPMVPAQDKRVVHNENDEIIYLVSGEAHIDWGKSLEKSVKMKSGHAIFIPAGVSYRPYYGGSTRIIVVVSPSRVIGK